MFNNHDPKNNGFHNSRTKRKLKNKESKRFNRPKKFESSFFYLTIK